MRPHMLPATMFPFFVIAIFILIQVPASLCADEEYYLNCSSSYQCANINVSYPFWGQGRPEYCGYPGFELNCQGDALQITIGSDIYRVLGIDNTSQTLKVARADSWNTNCSQYLVNTNLDINLFSYASTTVKLTLYYSCTTAIPVASNQFSCTINDTSVNGYYATEGASNFNIPSGTCNNQVIVPILQTAAETIRSNLTSGGSPNLAEALNGGFDLQWSASNDLCTQCANSGGKCGYNQTTTAFVCYCANGTYVNTCGGTLSTTVSSVTGHVGGINWKGKLIIGVTGVIAASIFFLCCIRGKRFFYKVIVFWRKDTEADQNIKEFIRNCGSLAPQQFSYSDVKRMTNSFKDKLGQGGYGGVYKGQLPDGRIVAVKVLNESKGNGEEFINEVASISRTSHVNVVTLLGFCYKRTKRALIYEFMPNGSLDKFIYEGPQKTNHPLEWNKLYQIAVGIARGLEYLHRGCNTRILHFDIKPHNILLDEDFVPKISDFGLAKLCQRKDSIVSMLGARGTAGYIAPEVFSRNFGRVSHKSDVYSYGMMVLEMVGGRKKIEVEESQTSEIYFPHWIYKQLDLGEDLRLHGVETEEEAEISRKMVLVGLWCIQTIPSDRPSMSKVLEMLEGNPQSLQVPPKPFLSSPPMPLQHSSTTSLS